MIEDARGDRDPIRGDVRSTEDLAAERAAIRRSISLHLGGLRTWGIDRVFGEPVPPRAAPAVPPRGPGRSHPGAVVPSSGSPTSRSPSPAAPAPELSRAIPPAPPSATPEAPRRVGGEPSAEPAVLLDEIAREVAACRACRLCDERTNTVPGVGDPRAPLMFVGEAPGRDEDLRGEPFVGRAGQLLDKIIGALGFRRDEVYIANTLKCRPPNNRDPLPDESGACTPFLERQVRAIAPRMIVALGRPAARFLTGQDVPLGRLRGGKHHFLGVPVVVTYHPAYLLRNPAAKADCWHDLQVVVREFGRAPLGHDGD